MLDSFAYGRKDAKNISECGPLSSFPTPSTYVEMLKLKGFSDEEVVALASVEAFGVYQNPSHTRWSSFPKFDSYYY